MKGLNDTPYSSLYWISVFLIGCHLPLSIAWASCSIDHGTDSEFFTRHVGNECSDEDRRLHAVSANEVLAALEKGQSVDLAGVVVNGDLFLDLLPLTPVHIQDLPSPRIQEAFRTRQLTELRQIPGSITIRNSAIHGTISTRLKDGYVLAKGPITITATTFERAVDFSRMVFSAPVDFSDAVFLREGYFVQAIFDRPARFERTAFGIHTRFHRAVFGEGATFLRAGFNGLAELLEVSFEQDTSFSRTYFKMGTGFSGSRFGGNLDFSEALFDREVYFLFTLFEKDAYFRRSTFRGQADFSDAQFRGLHDFTKVLFDVEPNFTRTRMSGDPPRRSGLQNPRFLYGIGASLAIFTVFFVLVLRKREQ